MPENAEMDDFNRVLLIKNARLEDQGNYVCHVKRGNKARDSKIIALRLEGNYRALLRYLLRIIKFEVLEGLILRFFNCENNISWRPARICLFLFMLACRCNFSRHIHLYIMMYQT